MQRYQRSIDTVYYVTIFLPFLSITRLPKAKKMKFETRIIPSYSGVTRYEKKGCGGALFQTAF